MVIKIGIILKVKKKKKKLEDFQRSSRRRNQDLSLCLELQSTSQRRRLDFPPGRTAPNPIATEGKIQNFIEISELERSWLLMGTEVP